MTTKPDFLRERLLIQADRIKAWRQYREHSVPVWAELVDTEKVLREAAEACAPVLQRPDPVNALKHHQLAALLADTRHCFNDGHLMAVGDNIERMIALLTSRGDAKE